MARNSRKRATKSMINSALGRMANSFLLQFKEVR